MAIIKRKGYLGNTIDNCNNSQKELHKVCSSLLDTTKETHLPTHDNPCDLANNFNNYFKGKIVKIRDNFQFRTNPSLSTTSTKPNFNRHNDMVSEFSTLSNFTPLNLSQLRTIIKSNPIKTSPADNIPATLLSECLDELLPVLLHIANLSLSSGSMDGLKLSNVTPLLKKYGLDANNLANYRPINNILYLSKIIERIVLIQLNTHMSKNNLHIGNQSGYKKYHSCETLLVRLMNDIFTSLDSGSCVVLLLLDLSAAFDTVDHSILLKILHDEIGLRGTVLQWFASFLHDRFQSVVIDGHKSDKLNMPFGVPQGSVLGPVLFNIYVRSLISMVQKLGFSMLGYADDHQVSSSFKAPFKFNTLRIFIPNCINTISNWMANYFLKLNPSKSQIIVFTPNSETNQIFIQYITLQNSYICVSPQVLNLGIIIDNNLHFTPHINMILAQGYKLLRNIAGIRKYLSQDHIITLIHSLVVSKIDNCNSILYGANASEISRLQRFQNACARFIYGKKARSCRSSPAGTSLASNQAADNI